MQHSIEIGHLCRKSGEKKNKKEKEITHKKVRIELLFFKGKGRKRKIGGSTGVFGVSTCIKKISIVSVNCDMESVKREDFFVVLDVLSFWFVFL